MSQNVVNYGTDPSGVQLLDELLSGEQQNRLTMDGGNSRPPYAEIGTIWTDKSVTGKATLKRFNGTSDDVLMTIDETTGVITIPGVVDTDLSNLSGTGLNRFANPALTNSPYTTNRILEIPQDIKLEFSNGTLTLKAGSKVYVPNGSGNFDIITTTQDYTADTSAYSGFYVLGINTTTGLPSGVTTIQNCVSGATAPSSPTSLQGWYDTTNNVIKRYSGGSIQTTFRCSFPLCSVTSDGANVTSIDQIFNGFGYIGSTVFALPGVKVQCANGRNEDGTYITTNYDVTSVLTHTQTSSSAGKIITEFLYSPDNLGGNTANLVKYDSDKNFMYSGSTKFTGIALFDITLDANVKITKFEQKTVDSVINSNEFYQLKANVGNAVTLTDNQTISGQKKYTSGMFYLKNPAVTGSDFTPTNWYARTLQFVANDDSRLGLFQCYQYNVGDYYATRMAVYRKINGTEISGVIEVSVNGLGNTYATCPTPASATDNSTRIATTAWCTTASKEGNLIGAPNYSAAVDATINSSTPYTATKNGWIQVRMPAAYGYIYIDGVVFALSITVPNSYATYQAGIVPIAKGSSVTTDNAANLSIKFIPCK